MISFDDLDSHERVTLDAWEATTISNPSHRSSVLREVATRMAWFDVDRAMQIAEGIPLPQSRELAYCHIAEVLSEDDPRRAMQIVRQASAADSVGRALVGILPNLAAIEPEQAVLCLEAVLVWQHRRSASYGVLQSLIRQGRKDLDRTVACVVMLPVCLGESVMPLARLIGWRARTDFEGAMRLGFRFEERQARRIVFQQIACSLVPAWSSRAAEAAGQLKRPWRPRMLRWIAEHLHEAQPPEQQRAIERAPNEYWRRHFARCLQNARAEVHP